MKLYDLELSGNCYKVRLFCALLGLAVERVPVDTRGREHKQPAFLGLNPLGQIPVLVDGGTVVRDSQAILVYLAREAERTDWLPLEAAPMAEVMQWLSIAANEIARGPMDARAHVKFGRPLDLGAALAKSRDILAVMDAHLAGRPWLACGRPTIADLACFPYVALAHEGGIDPDAHAHVQIWIARVKQLPGFVPMPGIA